MGVKSGSQVLYSIIGLQRGDVADIAHGLARDRNMESLTIDVDCSNICFKVGKSVHTLATFLIKSAQASALSQYVMAKSDQRATNQPTNASPTGRRKPSWYPSSRWNRASSKVNCIPATISKRSCPRSRRRRQHTNALRQQRGM